MTYLRLPHITKTAKRLYRVLLISIFMAVWPALMAQTPQPVIRIGGNVYGGGNKGDLEFETNVTVKSGEIAGAVYGGARMADVLSTNVVIEGGIVNYVYGGNDITGHVRQETNVDIRSSVVHDVYGGGNGSYVYTDVAANKDLPEWADFYYEPGANSVAALNDFRPNVPKATIHLQGASADTLTYIGGAVYCGGNSATLKPPTGAVGTTTEATLKIGSHVVANKGFMGSNGENMITAETLSRYADGSVSSLDLTDAGTFDSYMQGVDVTIRPSLQFDTDDTETPENEEYQPYSTRIGSFYGGGNVGSMSAPGTFVFSFSKDLVIFDKLVGGCNNANIAAGAHNAAHRGGLTGSLPAGATNKVQLNIANVKLEPRVLTYDSGTDTYSYNWNLDANGLLQGANIYGGCYESGYINGGVDIQITENAISDSVFVAGGAGVTMESLRDDPLVSTMSVYGGGYGENSEVWGDVKLTLSGNARILKAYGGGEMGVVGKRAFGSDPAVDYNTTVTMNANIVPGHYTTTCIYGGGFKGLVTGNTTLNLNSGTVHWVFGGACNADINGSTEVFVGLTSRPIVKVGVYGGNDFGGQIYGTKEHSVGGRINASIPISVSTIPQTVRSNTYVEYYAGSIQGSIYGGAYGAYDYTSAQYYADAEKTQPLFESKPTLLSQIDRGTSDAAANSFVNVLSPSTQAADSVSNIFGGGQGRAGDVGNVDMYNTYVLLHSAGVSSRPQVLAKRAFGAGDCSVTTHSLIDVYTGNVAEVFGASKGASTIYLYPPETSRVNLYPTADKEAMDIYGAGAYSGSREATVNLYGGKAHNVYGASLNEGRTASATINVPVDAVVSVNSLFGGGKGESAANPCDVKLATVNYLSKNATVNDGIYGGNHDYRLTIESQVNIPVAVRNREGELMDVYGAGYGTNTYAQNTHVNLTDSALVRNVFGGGRNGKVVNLASINALIPNPYEPLDESTFAAREHNTNVLINRGATVARNAYAGGEGNEATVSGATGLILNGGKVTGDLYGGGNGGHVRSANGMTPTIVASTNVYALGGTMRNAYGGGLNGNVGTTEIDAETHITVGERDVASDYYSTDPTVERSLYGGGEKGAVYGTAHLTINNAHVGYKYDATTDEYVENVDLREADDKLLAENGNAFGAGYGQGATVDNTVVNVYGGLIRNSLYGGGEIAAVGRGRMVESGHANSTRVLGGIDKAGGTFIEMFSGQVQNDVFGGGRGYSYDLNGNELIDQQFYTSGYVFGKTDVRIHGGVIGTPESLENGYGNVFGGGNIGYVYSAGEADTSTDTGSPNHYYYYKDGHLTEDCRVVISPYAKVLSPVTINGKNYSVNEYVPIDDLNTLRNKYSDSRWSSLSDAGVIVRNAVFAGGNVAIGSDKVYANATTVFGNVTATLRDVYHRDLITIGTEHVGGLYGGGNLAIVNGYRELHIENYGTDYYGLEQEVTLDQYSHMSDRERAYFELKYECVPTGGVTIAGEHYDQGQTISEEDYTSLPSEFQSESYWKKAGFCSIYAGRLLNTLQRADFAGIFGSRMVLQGARDRVSDVVDYTEYTINRVGELSLNAQRSTAGDTDEKDAVHGNYFGIYNVVNYLGNLSSDVKFEHVRQSDSNDVDGTTSYLDWKRANARNRKRNTATCHNKVALASGVFLELTTERSTADTKVYGDITGVVELDMINVRTDVGGGYVYARNEHGVPTFYPNRENVTLSTFNSTAVTFKRYEYSATNLEYIQTSGNFIHDSHRRIIDDCFPHNGVYNDGYVASPAHYWFVRGEVYIYDQVISAYTGSATAYSTEVKIPLTVAANSHGRLTMLNVQPNLYAYYSDYTRTSTIGANGVLVDNESKTFMLNDVISYWDYQLLPANERAMFVSETMVNAVACTIDGVEYAAGEYVLENEGAHSAYRTFAASTHTIVNNMGETVSAEDVFHSSNNLGHDNGYALTLSMDMPKAWDNYYSVLNGANSKISTAAYNALSGSEQGGYIQGPTYRPRTSGVYGQREYTQGEIIPHNVWQNYTAIAPERRAELQDQAEVERAYVATSQVSYSYNGHDKTVNVGTAIPESEYQSLDAATRGKFATAQVCTSTLELNKENYLLQGDLVTTADVSRLASDFGLTTTEISEHLSDAYICKTGGNYGGKWFESNQNYNAIESWCSLSETDRANFEFSYDALDLIIDGTYPGTGQTDVYDNQNPAGPYHLTTPVDYEAVYNGTSAMQYYDTNGALQTVSPNTVFDRDAFETQIPNEQYYYAPINVPAITDPDGEDYYVVNTSFMRGDVPYSAGHVIPYSTYEALSSSQKGHVTIIHFNPSTTEQTYYFCRESYVVGANGGYDPSNNGQFSNADNSETYAKGDNVPLSTLVTKAVYETFPNSQLNFDIRGVEPTETSTLYVSRESDIYDLSKERIITVVYQYSYDESDDEGSDIELINEMHVLNIHIVFQSGVPTIGQLMPPATVLPGATVGMKKPNVTPGAYEILGGGWEMFADYDDALNSRNGEPYANNETPMYWYQNNKYYVSYYAKTYLGKTYSNPVPFSIANYHDLSAVMADTAHHMHVDYDPSLLERNCKIYVNDYSEEGKNGLDLLSDLFNLSNGETLAGHEPMEPNVPGCENLEIIMRTDVNHSEPWTPIGEGGQCFGGTLHGDGYTVSGLDKSLFANLCGNIYNLGVTGTFTTAGLVDNGDGHVENCWVLSTATATPGTKAVFGNPTNGAEQVENCYYSEDGGYSTDSYARAMPAKAFYNGTVTYDLNGFYLKERFDRNVTVGGGSASRAIGDTYVANRYSDGDFIYAEGLIPQENDIRYTTDINNAGTYTPIWPDDYLFFGQTLTYGYRESILPHNAQPTHITKIANEGYRLPRTDRSNRVYRAPAYFRSKVMGEAHYNLWANFAARSSAALGSRDVYPGMTAIDFSGYNDAFNGSSGAPKQYQRGLNNGLFYAPLLDDGGLLAIRNVDLTRNLLVYTPASNEPVESAALTTRETILNANSDHEYAETHSTYRTVDKLVPTVSFHIVERTDDETPSYYTPDDHFLVDKEEFNAPISYTFNSNSRMWYQREPERYANLNSGWEGISLPFTVELVTTQTKGELTHFYQESTIGHEYWLRDYRDISGISSEPDKLKAIFRYPDKQAGNSKNYTNTFLWDTYYSYDGGDLRKDDNEDLYKRYYASAHTMNDYPLQQAATPYIIGFPGSRYYEFDLSGTFEPKNTLEYIGRLEPQVITFASAGGATIGVSDDEIQAVRHNNYSFFPNYLKVDVPAGGYTLNATGNAYELTTAATEVLPFRPYFISGTAPLHAPRTIEFSEEESELHGDPEQESVDDELSGKITVKVSERTIIVTSHLSEAAPVAIYGSNGMVLASFDLSPEEDRETSVDVPGIYIVSAAKGKFTTKLIVK